HSFGIHVAQLAGMPATIVERATAILGALEKAYGNSDMVPKGELRKRGKKATAQGVADVAESVRTPDVQLSMFQLDDPVLVQIRDQIKGLDINSLTPLEALNKLNEIKKIAGI
ncbi:MAG: DNA mismatch repair protein MutS, partial [Alistipes sp.]|nr:DNA mismatch repair protein MutS [Alistipes sp.]